MIEKSIHKSQHCQRNWDLSREIPTEDLETIKTAATQCPSKQNESFYKVVFVHDRDTINKIADCTKGFSTSSQYPYKANATGMDNELQINTQVQANLLVAFVRDFGTPEHASTPELNMYHANNGKIEPELLEVSINNITARKCYKSLGFIQVGIRKNYYSKGDDAILYDLEIA